MKIDRSDIEIRAKSIEPEVKEWFHYLHQNPELGFEEIKTAKFVEEKLKSFGNIEVIRIGKTGVLGILKTGKQGKTIAFRADMDALPIEEDETHVIHSRKKGKMHACGHDGHTATLLGAARILSEIKDSLCGEIRFIFQPSEEVQPGGAVSMVEGGVLQGTDHIFGFHYSIDEKPGTFSVHPGENFAANYTFDITVVGKEGHAAFPQLARDPILASSQIIEALYMIASKQIDPLSQAVISVTKIQGGTTYNSFPAKVCLGGTIRFLDDANGKILIHKAKEVVHSVSEAYGCKSEWRVKRGCDLLYNDPILTKQIKTILSAQFGEDKVLDHDSVMGCEDFSEYLKYVKGAYFRVGCMTIEEDGTVWPTHNRSYQLNEKALKYGVQSILLIILGFLEWEE